MQIVIDIPEEYHENLLKNHRFSSEEIPIVSLAIATGTPLPKGHGRLIDADAVLVEPFGNTYKDIDIAETIIEADKEQE